MSEKRNDLNVLGDDLDLPIKVDETLADPRQRWDEEGHRKNWKLLPNFVAHMLDLYEERDPTETVVMIELRTQNIRTHMSNTQKLVFPSSIFDGVPAPNGMDPTAAEYREVMAQIKTLGRPVDYADFEEAMKRGPDGKLKGFSKLITLRK